MKSEPSWYEQGEQAVADHIHPNRCNKVRVSQWQQAPGAEKSATHKPAIEAPDELAALQVTTRAWSCPEARTVRSQTLALVQAWRVGRHPDALHTH